MESIGSGLQLMDVVLRFFQEDQWNYLKIEGKSLIRAGHRGEHGTWICYARVDEGNCRFIFHSVMGMNVRPEYRAAAAEYLTRANMLLPVGNFEINMDDGDVRCKTSVETPDGDLSVATVRALVYANLRAMDTYFPGLLSVIHAGLSPSAAIARVESRVAEQEP
jgi:hypothetical protein